VFPGALRRAKQAWAATLASVTLVLLFTPFGSGSDRVWYMQMTGDVFPRTIVAALWLFATTTALAVWHRVPLHPFRRLVVVAYGAYLLLLGVLHRMIWLLGWDFQPIKVALDQPAYVVLAGWWTYLAWRPLSADAGPSETLARIRERFA
jgi:hypothetical protein